jgi:hypothetical protein
LKQRNKDEVNEMMLTAEKTELINSESQFLMSIGMPDDERVLRLRALAKLMDGGWPDDLINNKMINRSLKGLVPAYTGVSSVHEYYAQWSGK